VEETDDRIWSHRLEKWRDKLLVEGVWQGGYHQVRLGRRGCRNLRAKAIILGTREATRLWGGAHPHRNPRISQIQSMSAPLVAITNDRNCLSHKGLPCGKNFAFAQNLTFIHDMRLTKEQSDLHLRN